MAVGPDYFPELAPIAGVRVGTTSAGIKKVGRRDLVVFELAQDSSVAAVFTRNRFCAAPVQLAKAHLASNAPRYFLINTGNANAGTGESGLMDAKASCQALADLAGVDEREVLPFSTGVIGEPLPIAKLVAALPQALRQLSGAGWTDAAQGILTTDTRPKGATASCTLSGQEYQVTGIAKGSGMIRPDMATMLAFVATDAPVAQPLLQKLLAQANEQSFNRISVDGDTSTNDACMLAATGAAGGAPLQNEADDRYPILLAAITQVCQELAQAIVKDGEGATKFISIEVEQGANEQECLAVAYTIAHSPLVKTALFASDPNWGRILAAVGRAGIEDLEVERVALYLDQYCIAERGGRAASYTEEQGQAVMKKDAFTIRVQLGRGAAKSTVWTCDLSHDYVSINADYRS